MAKGSKGTVPVGDTQIAYTTVGSGKPLIVVHGGPGIGPGYLRGLDAWSDEFKVVYYDQRGSGDTPLGDVTKVSFSGGIEDLDALREGLGIERANLVGHSFGALLALLYAAHRPETTGSLVLLNPAPPFVPEMQDRLWANMAARRSEEDDAEKKAIEESEGFAQRDPRTLERHVLNMYLPFFKDRESIRIVDMGFTEITAANVLEAWERTFKDLETLDPVGSLAQIECPTLVVHSELDPAPEDFARLLTDKIAGSTYAFLKGANHFAHVETPEFLADAVKPFLRSHAVEPSN